MGNTITKQMDKSGIEQAIKSIQGRGSKLDHDIQLTGLSILAHIEKNGEVSLFTKLYNAMPSGSRRNALVKWAMELGQVGINKDKKTSKDVPFVFNKEGKTRLDKAEQYAWHTFKPEAEPRDAFDFDKALVKFQEMLKSKIKAGTIDAHDRRVEVLMALTATVEEAAPVVETNPVLQQVLASEAA